MYFLDELPDSVSQSISTFARELYKKEPGLNRIVREDIFGILQTKCTLVFFPLGNDDIDGFHVSRPINGKEENFVYINTSKYLEKQIFTAAHELGHILKIEERLEDNCKEYDKKKSEAAVNKFAAFLLVPLDIFKKQVNDRIKIYCTDCDEKRYSISNINFIRLVAYLMNFFFVPFKTIVYRLYEAGFINKEVAIEFTTGDYESMLKDCIEEEKYERLFRASNKKQIDGYAELLSRTELQKNFLDTKIENIRKLFDIPKIDNIDNSSGIELEIV